MKPSRIFLLGTGLSLLLAGGCATRTSVEVEELQADNQRLTNELQDLHEEAKLLEIQRNNARDELVKHREKNKMLEEQLRKAVMTGAEGIPNITVIEGGKGLRMEQDFAFPKGSAALTDQGRETISQVARLLMGDDYEGTKIVVEGHTDNTPVKRKETVEKFGDNWGLSAMRSAAVVRALRESGVPADRLHGAFRGEHQPIESNSSREGQAANRRVEIFVSL